MEEMARKPRSELWEHPSLPELVNQDIEVWADQMAMLMKGVVHMIVSSQAQLLLTLWLDGTDN